MNPDRLSKAIVALVELVGRLRGPGGCPWDAKQTDSTIKIYLLEEAYEVLEAVEGSVPGDVCLELGDLLFQVLFLARLAEERKEFDLVQVIEKITDKMIRRHPHVFGNVKVETAEDVALNWSRIKEEEKGFPCEKTSLLESIPVNLPALLRSHRLGERASKAGFDWSDKDEVWESVQKMFEKLRNAEAEKESDTMAEALGELLFGLVGLARHWGLNAEDLLRSANQKFLERFVKTEKGP
jgi:tetrapyrrole methylase family protein/MazG family protein/ATP diphosphatase